ncbi:MAG: DUF2442 domain-containing protein [Synergistaceae bacterium]|jgi:hypothetical protein|nr:DUF2442 domain-containing protein [Synergistaceae bacterium]
MLQPKIIDLETLSDYKLKIHYETGEERLFDVSPYIRGDWYGRLKESSYFRTVHVIPGGAGIEWPDGQDIAPHELYEASAEVK